MAIDIKQVRNLQSELNGIVYAGLPNLVYSNVLTSATDTIDIPDLNFSAAKYYEVYVNLVFAIGTATTFKIYAGDPTLDTTDTNYNTRKIIDGSSSGVNAPEFATLDTSGHSLSIKMICGQHSDGKFFVIGTGAKGGSTPTGILKLIKSVSTFGNVTALRLFATQATGFPAGASIQVFKLNGPGFDSGMWDVIIEDQKTQNTPAGTFTAGSFLTRDLNTFVVNVNSIATLGSNQFTLPPGTYDITWSAPAHNVQRHQTALYSVTAAAIVAYGGNSFSLFGGGGSTTHSEGATRVTIDSSTVYELQHRCESTKSSDGFGVESNFGTEVYARVCIKRLSDVQIERQLTPFDIDNTDSPYTLTSAGVILYVDTSSGSVTINLPTIVGNDDDVVTVRKVSTDANDIVVVPNGSQEIEGVNGNYSFNDEAVRAVSFRCKASGASQGWWLI